MGYYKLVLPLCRVIGPFTLQTVTVSDIVPILLVELIFLNFAERPTPEGNRLVY